MTHFDDSDLDMGHHLLSVGFSHLNIIVYSAF